MPRFSSGKSALVPPSLRFFLRPWSQIVVLLLFYCTSSCCPLFSKKHLQKKTLASWKKHKFWNKVLRMRNFAGLNFPQISFAIKFYDVSNVLWVSITLYKLPLVSSIVQRSLKQDHIEFIFINTWYDMKWF